MQRTSIQDGFNDNTQKTNSMLDSTKPNAGISLVSNNNIMERHLGDAVHLNRYYVKGDLHTGSQLFSSNLFNSIYNILPSDDSLIRSLRLNRKPT